MPEYAAALGDLYAKTEKRKKAKEQHDLVEYIGRLSALNQTLYNRELAYFYADHDVKVEQALELAKRELDYRQDIYAYDLLAWSLHKNDQNEEARDAIEKALKLGTKDAKLFYHAGMIHRALGDKEKAANFLARALATNPHFHPRFADSAAQNLMELQGEIGQASAVDRREEG
jgi:tetratricopeptide (TPR) repeat protein